jgi:hypothetical protein
VPKKSWQNTLTAEESKVADQLYKKTLDLKSTRGQTMSGTCKKHGIKMLTQKVFVGPDFHTTNLSLNKVTKVGALQTAMHRWKMPEILRL